MSAAYLPRWLLTSNLLRPHFIYHVEKIIHWIYFFILYKRSIVTTYLILRTYHTYTHSEESHYSYVWEWGSTGNKKDAVWVTILSPHCVTYPPLWWNISGICTRVSAKVCSSSSVSSKPCDWVSFSNDFTSLSTAANAFSNSSASSRDGSYSPLRFTTTMIKIIVYVNNLWQ